jgi:hypothetical protein
MKLKGFSQRILSICKTIGDNVTTYSLMMGGVLMYISLFVTLLLFIRLQNILKNKYVSIAITVGISAAMGCSLYAIIYGVQVSIRSKMHSELNTHYCDVMGGVDKETCPHSPESLLSDISTMREDMISSLSSSINP